MVEEVNRLGDRGTYRYNVEGQLTGSIAYSGRERSIEYREGEGLTIISFFDGTRNIIERDLAGNIVRVSNGTGTIRYRYDGGGRLIEQNDEGAGEITRYAYDRSGRRVRMQSGNRDVHYRYGSNGELLRVYDQSMRLEVSYEYDARGRETRRMYGNGVRQETLYDAIGRVVMIRELDTMNRLLRAEGYLYDTEGRRSHSVNEEGLVTRYEYDHISRLATVLYPWTNEKAEADRKEAEQAGLYFTQERGNGERYSLSGAEQAALREVLNLAAPMRGNAIGIAQMMWRESYTYDRNGNRLSKTTPWGTIRYEYDAENRLLRKGDIVYTNDRDGNVLSEAGLRYEGSYEYNGQNRMIYSEVINHVERTHEVSFYSYDALGRRTLTTSVTGESLRTLYDGRSFEVIREGETFRSGGLTTQFSQSSPFGNIQNNQTTGERYRWVSDGSSSSSRSTPESYTAPEGRFGSIGVTLYGRGEPVAMSYSSSTGSRSVYFGKDIMGSVRTATSESGGLEERYEYDAFGQPYKGDLSGMQNLGYTGKPYDNATGLYNYGYRDYRPATARFTTVDPIRDGNNWYSYVNNDPVNWIDRLGLEAEDIQQTIPTVTVIIPDPLPAEVVPQTQPGTTVLAGNNELFLQTQLDLVGSNYVWGGRDPAIYGGLDCSGAIIYGLEFLGNEFNGRPTVSTLYDDYTTPVTGTPQPGDLRFMFDEGDNVSHVQTIINSDGDRIDPSGDRTNTRDNPGEIIIRLGPLPESGEIRRLNFN